MRLTSQNCSEQRSPGLCWRNEIWSISPTHASILGLKEVFMLVLSRQSDETIIIGDNIRVTIVEVRGDKVRIGIDAPRDVAVHRQEIYDAIRREAASDQK
jgi:carbon storage regulator